MVATLSKIEQAKAEFCGLDLASRLGELGAAGWESLDEADLTIRLKWLGIFFRPVTPGRFMVRLRLGYVSAQIPYEPVVLGPFWIFTLGVCWMSFAAFVLLPLAWGGV